MASQELINGVDLTSPLCRARSSEVFDLGDGKVLKLYFADIDENSAGIEELNTTVAFENGCTPMECFGRATVDGRNGLIFQKLNGCSLTDMPGKNPLIVFRAGEILATLHAMVHSKSSHKLRDIRKVAVDTLQNEEIFSFLSAADKEKLIAYIENLPESDNILHMDFHTDNILCDGTNYQVIDWMTAMRGNPLAEVSMMNFLHHDAELFPGSSKFKIFLMQLVRVGIYNSFIKHYEKLTGRNSKDSREWDILAYILRLGIWNIAYERGNLQNKILQFVSEIK